MDLQASILMLLILSCEILRTGSKSERPLVALTCVPMNSAEISACIVVDIGQFMIKVLDARTFDLKCLNPHMNTWHVDLGNACHDCLPPHVHGILR